MKEIIRKYPKASFMIISKGLWIINFFYTVWIIQGHSPSLRQYILGSIYTIATLPFSYWLTYNFGEKK